VTLAIDAMNTDERAVFVRMLAIAALRKVLTEIDLELKEEETRESAADAVSPSPAAV
jgi:hypothetical protein